MDLTAESKAVNAVTLLNSCLGFLQQAMITVLSKTILMPFGKISNYMTDLTTPSFLAQTAVQIPTT